MKALSIRQPWVWAILHAGKDIENRDWAERNPGRNFRGTFFIHASLGMSRAERDDFRNFYVDLECDQSLKLKLPRLPAIDELQRGGIVGVARVVDVVHEHSSPWFFGPVGLVLADVRPLPFTPLKGALGFFNVPDAVAREALAA